MERASCHNTAVFFKMSTPKSVPTRMCFVCFDFDVCFWPLDLCIFSSSRCPKCSTEVLYPCWLRNLFRGTSSPRLNFWSHATLEKHGVSRFFKAFARLHILFRTLSLLWFFTHLFFFRPCCRKLDDNEVSVNEQWRTNQFVSVQSVYQTYVWTTPDAWLICVCLFFPEHSGVGILTFHLSTRTVLVFRKCVIWVGNHLAADSCVQNPRCCSRKKERNVRHGTFQQRKCLADFWQGRHQCVKTVRATLDLSAV